MTDLTDADRFEIVEARHKDRGDVTENVSIDRWSKYGKDRLYLNGLRTGDGYLDLQTGDSDGDSWTKVSADHEVDGDELTIEVGNKRAIYTIVVRVHGDGFEETEDEPVEVEESEPEIECADETAPEQPSAELPDADAGGQEHAIMADGGHDIPDAARDAEEMGLAEYARRELGRELSEDDYVSAIGDLTLSHRIRRDYNRATFREGPGRAKITLRLRELDHTPVGNKNQPGEVIAETTEAVGDGGMIAVQGDVSNYRLCLRGIGSSGDVANISIDDWDADEENWREIHHDGGVATTRGIRKHTVQDGRLEWEAEWIESEYWDGVEDAEEIVNELVTAGLSPGQAWAYYGVEIRDNSRNAWSKVCGYSDHSAVSEPLRKAEEKLR